MLVLFWIVASLTFVSCIGKPKDPHWDGLTVKFGDPSTGDVNLFSALPVTEDEAINEDWVKIGDCKDSANWMGKRYVKDEDYAIILLFDVRGNSAGIQTSFPKDKAVGYPADFKPFVEDGDRLTVTAYFIKPKNICKKKKKHPRKSLYLQGTSDPLQSVKIRGWRKLRDSPIWTEGKCVPRMGTHYWGFNQENLDNACFADDTFPAFVLHSRNHKGVVGFGWSLLMDLPSSRYEHPPPQVLSMFFKDVPMCVANAQHRSTMHIYFTTRDLIMNTGNLWCKG